MNSVRKLVSICALIALALAFASPAFAQQPAGKWVRERHTSYPDAATAARVAQMINSNTVPGWRNAAADSAPHAVTRDFAVFAERFYADPAPAPQEFVLNGQLTNADRKDRLRLNMHAKT